MFLASQIATASLAAVILLASPGVGAAQQHQPAHNTHLGQPAAPGRPASGPFAFSVYGAFQRMMHAQDFSSKAQLGAVMQGGATEAVGAVSGLRGEITAIDGKLLVTYGAPCATCGHPGEDSATLLATAKVAAWHHPIKLPSNLTAKALDDFIIAEAKKAGLDMNKPFPIRMTGTLTGVKMHVLRGPGGPAKGHSSGHAAAQAARHATGHRMGHGAIDQTDIAAERIDGTVVGFYAPAPLQGIVTHPGDPFHYHWVDAARTKTAHLDVFGMQAGAELQLPVK